MTTMKLDVYTYADGKGANFSAGSRGKEWIARCIVPGCSSRHDAFSVQPEGKSTGRWAGYGAWMCRKCWDPSEMITVEYGPERGSQRKRGWGTIADLVMACEGTNYRDAEHFIMEYEGGIIPIASRPALQAPKTDEEWFSESAEYLILSQRVGQAERELVHAFLASRGLIEATATHLGMGYSFDTVKLDDGSYRKIPFLVIPWYKDKIENIRYRRINRRNLHNPLPADEKDCKYKLRWGSTNDALYLGESLLACKRPTFIVESELDAATILQEAGDLINVVATGSTDAGRNAVNEARLRRQPFVFISFDTDSSGEEASKYWLSRLDKTKSARYKPLMHDVNEMHTKGLSVRTWVESGLAYYSLSASVTPALSVESHEPGQDTTPTNLAQADQIDQGESDRTSAPAPSPLQRKRAPVYLASMPDQSIVQELLRLEAKGVKFVIARGLGGAETSKGTQPLTDEEWGFISSNLTAITNWLFLRNRTCCLCTAPAMHSSPSASFYCTEHYWCGRGHVPDWVQEDNGCWTCRCVVEKKPAKLPRLTIISQETKQEPVPQKKQQTVPPATGQTTRVDTPTYAQPVLL